MSKSERSFTQRGEDYAIEVYRCQYLFLDNTAVQFGLQEVLVQWCRFVPCREGVWTTFERKHTKCAKLCFGRK